MAFFSRVNWVLPRPGSTGTAAISSKVNFRPDRTHL